MPRKVRDFGERMGPDRASSLSAAEIQGLVRRMGFALHKMHELVMTRVIADEDIELAEELNDALKPAVDYLMHFTLGGDDGTGV